MITFFSWLFGWDSSFTKNLHARVFPVFILLSSKQWEYFPWNICQTSQFSWWINEECLTFPNEFPTKKFSSDFTLWIDVVFILKIFCSWEGGSFSFDAFPSHSDFCGDAWKDGLWRVRIVLFVNMAHWCIDKCMN